MVGEDLPHTTHSYDPYDALADETLSVTVVDEEGITIKDESFTVGELEDLIYGKGVSVVAAEKARAKAYYNVAGYSDLYEGVDLNYLLFERSVFLDHGDSHLYRWRLRAGYPEVSLADIVKHDYVNELTGVSGLSRCSPLPRTAIRW